jgi:glycosyltransferase involved in cell wall biosynthesis
MFESIDFSIGKAFEIIVVNDGSKDNIEEAISPYVKKNPECVRYVYKSNGNWGSSLNFTKEM